MDWHWNDTFLFVNVQMTENTETMTMTDDPTLTLHWRTTLYVKQFRREIKIISVLIYFINSLNEVQ